MNSFADELRDLIDKWEDFAGTSKEDIADALRAAEADLLAEEET
jgi:hypothetical protein